MNQLTIIGNLTRDPESRNVQDRTVCNFTVAVNRRQRDANGQQVADFFHVAAWEKMGENCQKYLTKGKKVCVTGSVSVRTFQAQDGSTKASMDVVARDVEFLSPAGESGQSNSAPAQGDVQPNLTPVPVDTDELPF